MTRQQKAKTSAERPENLKERADADVAVKAASAAPAASDPAVEPAKDAAVKPAGAAAEERIRRQIAAELGLPVAKVAATVRLLDEGNTIPFIARYRKEATGELDETQIRAIEERLRYRRSLEERKGEVVRLIAEQGKLTDELRRAIEEATKLQEVEDLYRPFRPKRKTRASVAKERGLEPLADWIASRPAEGDPRAEALRYVDPDKEVPTVDDALQGALDILAERIADDPDIRGWVRRFSFEHGELATEAKDGSKESVYDMYYDFREPVRKIPPHRVLAINRGEREDVLNVRLEVPEARILEEIGRRVIVGGRSATDDLLRAAVEDAYKRLIAPAVERDVRSELTEKAEEQAIKVFAENLRRLLLQPPVRGKTVMGIDPAYRTGCKVAVVDETGKLLDVAVVYPTPPHNDVERSARVLRELIERHRVDLIAIGNGTASRETELFVAGLIRDMPPERKLHYTIVNEAGASVYSASKLAQEEFPNLDVSERSAVSIARRLQDPLAELVKIDPKSIGVGQYQHDVSQKRLEETLAGVVESAVNHVGVDVNTASAALLSYVAGVNAAIAKNIVRYREANGKFRSRRELLNVPRLGEKTYEQCVGFLRIPDGDEPLDNTPIHPESYPAVERLLEELGLGRGDLGKPALRERLQAVDVESLAARLGVGVPTLRDILDSLQRPGRDPRDELPKPIFRTDVLRLEDLKPGMELKGTVRNVLDFGAFVDIGVKQDGLVHISQMSDKYVKHPLDVVSVGDVVTVWVLDVDVKRGRIALTMRKPGG